MCRSVCLLLQLTPTCKRIACTTSALGQVLHSNCIRDMLRGVCLLLLPLLILCIQSLACVACKGTRDLTQLPCRTPACTYPVCAPTNDVRITMTFMSMNIISSAHPAMEATLNYGTPTFQATQSAKRPRYIYSGS